MRNAGFLGKYAIKDANHRKTSDPKVKSHMMSASACKKITHLVKTTSKNHAERVPRPPVMKENRHRTTKHSRRNTGNREKFDFSTKQTSQELWWSLADKCRNDWHLRCGKWVAGQIRLITTANSSPAVAGNGESPRTSPTAALRTTVGRGPAATIGSLALLHQLVSDRRRRRRRPGRPKGMQSTRIRPKSRRRSKLRNAIRSGSSSGSWIGWRRSPSISGSLILLGDDYLLPFGGGTFIQWHYERGVSAEEREREREGGPRIAIASGTSPEKRWRKATAAWGQSGGPGRGGGRREVKATATGHRSTLKALYCSGIFREEPTIKKKNPHYIYHNTFINIKKSQIYIYITHLLYIKICRMIFQSK